MSANSVGADQVSADQLNSDAASTDVSSVDEISSHHEEVAINDFVVKFANVNGSGSASANELFAKAILRMGVPVSPRNIFPSNIQGLPTWYEVRVTEKGYLGRRGGVDLLVAMNPQTWASDLAELKPGGYVFYDSTKPMARDEFPVGVQVLGVPLTQLCNAAFSDPRQRQLFKNIMYVGALAVLLEMPLAVIETLFAEQYKGKEKLLSANTRALHIGADYARANLAHPLRLRVQAADAVGDKIFLDGNSAAALGGASSVSGQYPWSSTSRWKTGCPFNFTANPSRHTLRRPA